MEFIAHRINSIEELKTLNEEFGVELDLRDGNDGQIYISHDPFQSGDSFEAYLKEYHHGTMILNIKSERIEHKVIDLLCKYKINKYFFLDSSFPMIKLLSDNGEKNIALRFSEFEGLDTIRNMQGKVNWIWVDCFTIMPLTEEIALELKKMGFKICIVSPELQGQPEKIDIYKTQLKQQNIEIDAVCTKTYNIKRWQI